MSVLQVEHLSFSYPQCGVLHEVSVEVAAGEILAVLGPNGAGKSTLLRCLAGFLPVPTGTVRLDGADLAGLDKTALSRRLAWLSQQPEACRQTVFDAVLLGRMPHRGRSPRARDRALVESVLCRLGLTDLALRPLDRLSGGELQQVAIARALVQEPALLLLDEPTSALDLANRSRVLGLVRNLAREESLAVVMSMHDLATALRYADRFLLLHDGVVHAIGPVAAIDAEMIEAVYGVPVDIHHHRGRPVVLVRDVPTMLVSA